MNLVLDEAEEVSVKRQTRKTIGALNPGAVDAWSSCCCWRACNAGYGVASTSAVWCRASVHLACTAMLCPAAFKAQFPRCNSACCAGRILLKGDNITLMQTT
jgi:hypothetical protein